MNLPLKHKASVRSLIILFGIVLVVCGCSLNISMDAPQSAEIANADTRETFQEYLWYQNPVVLMLHIALMLAGAIGVTALLPAPYEEETKE
jgi:hypothetical protein